MSAEEPEKLLRDAGESESDGTDVVAAFFGQEAREFPENYRAGFVAVLGRPNVGKSTLINALLGQKVSIVSPKPQTTRNRLLGILTRDDAQIIFLDTPGIHNPLRRLGEIMVETAAATLPDADALLWVVDVSAPPTDEDRKVGEIIGAAKVRIPFLLGLNKVDRLEGNKPSRFEPEYLALAPGAEAARVSAVRGDGLDALAERLAQLVPLSPPLFPEDQVTDQQVRFMAGELVREAVLLHLRDEVPHSVAVLVNEFSERENGVTFIAATVYVERPTQKMIILGKDGAMIKKIGQAARTQIEELVETKVFLELWVKVRPKWRTDEEELRRLGYQMPKKKGKKGGSRKSPRLRPMGEQSQEP
jgi:GTP-binding protein Era